MIAFLSRMAIVGLLLVGAASAWGALIGSPADTRQVPQSVAVVRPVVAAPNRDWRLWPFKETSPWNHPIGSRAHYLAVPALADTNDVSLNFDGHWTSSIVLASTDDPLVRLLINASFPDSNWQFLDSGGRNCGNPPAVEARLRRLSSPAPVNPGNTYSTVSSDDDSIWVLPADYHRADQDYRPVFRMKRGACPSPDSDGLMAVFQPDGWVLDVYAGVVLSNGDVISGETASYIDARGDGTGWWNGRRASMLPSFAGLIRAGEIAAGRIPHALAAVIAPTALKRQAVWPAYAFDRNSNYSGTLPMGALLAIPPSVDVGRLGLTDHGKVIAKAAQDYGVYLVDRGGEAGIDYQAELNNPEIRWRDLERDLQVVTRRLQWVVNNGPTTIGGGGTPRVPLAPPLE